ncbi:MAG: restriction endonuclease [Planctomycetes bacterium]|nr:restriction endonuclease [Planctomycetota bacterium]
MRYENILDGWRKKECLRRLNNTPSPRCAGYSPLKKKGESLWRFYPVSAAPKRKEGELEFMDVWYPIQVKQKEKVGRPDIDAFEAVMMREDRTKGFFVSFDFSSDAMSEIQAFFKKTGKSIIALTVKDILDEQIAYKLA